MRPLGGQTPFVVRLLVHRANPLTPRGPNAVLNPLDFTIDSLNLRVEGA